MGAAVSFPTKFRPRPRGLTDEAPDAEASLTLLQWRGLSNSLFLRPSPSREIIRGGLSMISGSHSGRVRRHPRRLITPLVVSVPTVCKILLDNPCSQFVVTIPQAMPYTFCNCNLLPQYFLHSLLHSRCMLSAFFLMSAFAISTEL